MPPINAPSQTPTNQEISDWLKRLGKDRNWLARQCGVSGSASVDQWFSKGFSKQALAVVRLLMQLYPNSITSDEGKLIELNAVQFERIDLARRRAGYKSRKDYYTAAIERYTDWLEVKHKAEDAGEKVPPIFSAEEDAAAAPPQPTKKSGISYKSTDPPPSSRLDGPDEG